MERNNERNSHVGFFGWSKEEKIDFVNLRSPRLSKLPSPESSQIEEKNHFTFDTECYTHMLATRLQERVRQLTESSVVAWRTVKSRVWRQWRSARTASWRRRRRFCSWTW